MDTHFQTPGLAPAIIGSPLPAIDPCGPAILEALHRADGTAIYPEDTTQCEPPVLTQIDGRPSEEAEATIILAEKATACLEKWLKAEHQSWYDKRFAFDLAKDLYGIHHSRHPGDLDEGTKAWGLALRRYCAVMEGPRTHIVFNPSRDNVAKLRADALAMSTARYRTTLTMPFIEWVCDGDSAEASEMVTEVYRRIRQDVNEHAHKLKVLRDAEYRARVVAAGSDKVLLAAVLAVFVPAAKQARPNLASWAHKNIRRFPVARTQPPIYISDDDDADADDAGSNSNTVIQPNLAAPGNHNPRNPRKRARLAVDEAGGHGYDNARVGPQRSAPVEDQYGYGHTPAASLLADQHSYIFDQPHPSIGSRPDGGIVRAHGQPASNHQPQPSSSPEYQEPARPDMLDLEVNAAVRVLSASLAAAFEQQQHLRYLQANGTAPADAMPRASVARFPQLRQLIASLAELFVFQNATAGDASA